MAKKEAKKEEKPNKSEAFDLDEALEECPKPEWVKNAFKITVDTSKIKSQSDLVKAFKDYGEMR